jgi:REP element-mobilizing transposase RayT
MARNCVWVRVHLVWSTKHREPTIAEAWRESLYVYIAGIIKNKAGKLISIGGTADHVHIYLSQPSRVSLSVMVNAIKTHSCRWVRTNHHKEFAWQRGYGGFSMNLKNEARLRRYIANQKEIHRSRASHQEYAALVKVHGIEPTSEMME